tara:strand:- start:786 stop:992 length:207 start_codon:yes stop_codon:yes gene_type:complete
MSFIRYPGLSGSPDTSYRMRVRRAKDGDVFGCYGRDTRRTSSEDGFDSAGDAAEAGVIQRQDHQKAGG